MDRLVRHFQLMAANNRWANARLLGACELLNETAFAAPRTGYFPSLKETLNHVLAVDRYYLACLEGQGNALQAFMAEEEIASPGLLRAAQALQDARLEAFCASLGAADLERPVVTDRGEQGMIEERVDAVLAHLFQHQIHHRGQAHAMLSGTDVPPPQLDEFFLVFDRYRLPKPGDVD